MRLLDLFCCEGVGARGYIEAGFDVTGVDIEPRFSKRYPGRFVHADALAYVREHGHEYDVIHASPPCQAYSITKHTHSVSHPELIGVTRDALRATGKPYVIENVPGAPLIDPLILCGSMFGLHADDDDGTYLVMRRHRLFESNVVLYAPGPCDHVPGAQVAGAYGGATRDKWEARHVRKGGYVPAKPVQEMLLGVPAGAHTLHGLAQSIPPAYTRWIGSLILSSDATLDPVSIPPHMEVSPMTHTELTFEAVDVPTTSKAGRPKEPNPYAGQVKALADDYQEHGKATRAVATTVPADDHAKHARKIRAAAAEHNLSARTDSTGDVLKFWLVSKVTRKRKEEDAAK